MNNVYYRNLAESLEVQLKLFYMQLGLFHRIHCYTKSSLPSLEQDSLFLNSEHGRSSELERQDSMERDHLLIGKEFDEASLQTPANQNGNSKVNVENESEQSSSEVVNSDDTFVFVQGEDVAEYESSGSMIADDSQCDTSTSSWIYDSNGGVLKPMWVYACIDPMFSDQYHLIRDLGDVDGAVLTYDKVKSWGRIIFQGMGEDPPGDVIDVVHNEWYALHQPEMGSVNVEKDMSTSVILSDSFSC